jgi:hypothetical protein
MITVGTTVVSGSPINGGGGGGAPSGTGVVTVTSGAFDTPSSASDIVAAGISSMVGYDPAGTAIVSDGAGGIQPTSADVSTLLGAADAAAARAALGLTTPSLDTGNGWTINNVSGCVATFPGNGIARFTLSGSPAREDAASTNVERPFAYDGGAQYRVSVRPRAIEQTAGSIYPCLYLRNASRIVLFVWVYPSNQVCAGAWTSGGIGLQPPGFVSQTFNLDGTSSFNFTINGLNIPFVSVGTTYLPAAVYTHSLNFVPTHIGVCVNCAAGSSGVVDFSDLQIRVL